MSQPDNNLSNCRKNNWSAEDESMINKQIITELNAFHIYNFLYSYFLGDGVGYPGLANYFLKASDEELTHARALMKYQVQRGGEVSFNNSLIIPNLNFLNNEPGKSILYKAIAYALNAEQKVYDNLLHISRTTNDPSLEDYLNGFLEEQLKGQYELGVMLTEIERIGNDGYGLYQYDRNLSKD